jgi:hypothetical protein
MPPAETDAKIRTYSEEPEGVPAGTHYMGISGRTGMSLPARTLPVFAGNLRRAALTDLWTSSELFTAFAAAPRSAGGAESAR